MFVCRLCYVVWCCCNFPKHLPTVLFMFEIVLGVFLLVSTLRKPSVETSLPEISSCLQSLHTTSAQISSILGFFPSHIFTVSFKVSFACTLMLTPEHILSQTHLREILHEAGNVLCTYCIFEKGQIISRRFFFFKSISVLINVVICPLNKS